MKLAIVGYGKMGKTIERLAIERGHTIALIVDKDNQEALADDQMEIDVAIEFSTPSSVVKNIKACLQRNLPVVVGTTGWQDDLSDIKKIVEERDGTLFYASNFSLGVNIFFRLNEWLASVMNNYPAYKPSMEEIHHIHKLDEPSGTAITLANGLINQLDGFQDWKLNATDEKDKLPITSIRKGEVPGTHSITYQSDIDELSIQHKAYGREGFALGAILVAEWLQGKKGILTMNDFIKI